jgi:hypothetical protein
MLLFEFAEMFPHQNTVCISPRPIRAKCPASLILLNFITRKISCVILKYINSSVARAKLAKGTGLNVSCPLIQWHCLHTFLR